MPAKIEATVFAANNQLAQTLVEELFDGYPVEFDSFSTVGGIEQDLQKIYAQRPELIGVDPDHGYTYDQFYHVNCIRKYFK